MNNVNAAELVLSLQEGGLPDMLKKARGASEVQLRTLYKVLKAHGKEEEAEALLESGLVEIRTRGRQPGRPGQKRALTASKAGSITINLGGIGVGPQEMVTATFEKGRVILTPKDD